MPDFLRFRDRCEAVGIRVPVVPGMLPVTNFAQIQRITSMCGAKLPAEFVHSLERPATMPRPSSAWASNSPRSRRRP